MLKQKTVYIREEDLEAWDNVPNKAAFLHDALNGTYTHKFELGKMASEVADHQAKKLMKQVIENPVNPYPSKVIPTGPAKIKLPTTVISPARLENGICKIHGTPLDSRGKCLQKGCKYA